MMTQAWVRAAINMQPRSYKDKYILWPLASGSRYGLRELMMRRYTGSNVIEIRNRHGTLPGWIHFRVTGWFQYYVRKLRV